MYYLNCIFLFKEKIYFESSSNLSGHFLIVSFLINIFKFLFHLFKGIKHSSFFYSLHLMISIYVGLVSHFVVFGDPHSQ